MSDLTDQQLLREYAEHHSERAFGELVRRHLDFVYSAAQRRTRDEHLAKDVTQGVFLALARGAAQLIDRPVMEGWLHRTAQNLASNAIRTEVRRRRREHEATLMNELLATGADANWETIAPQLDEALGDLDDPEREALFLRYFKNQDFRAVGRALGVSDDAAQKRVRRAVDRLRERLAKRGITVGAGSLGVVLSAHAVQAAPAGLALSIGTAVSLAGTTLFTTTAVTATQAIAMTTIQKAIVTITLAALTGVGIYQARQAASLRHQVQTLRQQAPLLEEVQRLQGERASATQRIAGLSEELARAKQGNAELLRLRGVVGVLREETNRLGRLSAASPTAPAPAQPADDARQPAHYPREAWSFAGMTTPENTLQSFMWAKNRGDVTTAFATATPELAQQQKDRYFKGKTDDEISALLMESAQKQTGYQIRNKMVAAEDQVVFQVHIDDMPEGAYTLLTLKRIADEWKVSGVEERSETPFDAAR